MSGRNEFFKKFISKSDYKTQKAIRDVMLKYNAYETESNILKINGSQFMSISEDEFSFNYNGSFIRNSNASNSYIINSIVDDLEIEFKQTQIKTFDVNNSVHVYPFE